MLPKKETGEHGLVEKFVDQTPLEMGFQGARRCPAKCQEVFKVVRRSQTRKQASIRMTKVSVVIPTYNQARWIGRTLEALANQTRLPDQVVVVDDGSTDDTVKVVEALAKRTPYAVDLVQQQNGGPGSARNRGIEVATGDVVAFTDSDAVPRSTWLETAIGRLAQEGEDCAGIEGRVEDDQTTPPTIRTHQIHNLHGGHFLTCNVLYRMECLEKVGGFHTRFREDSDLAFSLLEAGYRIVFEPQAIVDHPPREGTTWEVFKLARKRKNDALLWSRHPKRANEYLGSLYPPSETLILIGELAILAAILSQTGWLGILGLLLLLVGLPRMVLASLEGRQYNNRDYLIVLAIGLGLPAVNCYYRTVGTLHKPAPLSLHRGQAAESAPANSSVDYP